MQQIFQEAVVGNSSIKSFVLVFIGFTDTISVVKNISGSGYNKISSSKANTGVSNGYFKEGNSGGGNYMKDKLTGKV
jgi:uncharacterized membrane protein